MFIQQHTDPNPVSNLKSNISKCHILYICTHIIISSIRIVFVNIYVVG